jgi:hypothetical protein
LLVGVSLQRQQHRRITCYGTEEYIAKRLTIVIWSIPPMKSMMCFFSHFSCVTDNFVRISIAEFYHSKMYKKER